MGTTREWNSEQHAERGPGSATQHIMPLRTALPRPAPAQAGQHPQHSTGLGPSSLLASPIRQAEACPAAGHTALAGSHCGCYR